MSEAPEQLPYLGLVTGEATWPANFTTTGDDPHWTATGPCLRCAHPTEANIHPTSISAAAGRSEINPGDVRAAALVTCDCRGFRHPGRPAFANGCGASWAAEVKRERSGRDGLHTVSDPGRADKIQRVSEHDLQTRDGITAIADKWATGLLTFVGALGLTGAFAINPARALEVPARACTFLLLTAALICASYAVFQAFAAAHGIPAVKSTRDYEETADRLRKQPELRIRRLGRAYVLSAAATVSLIAANLLLWFGPVIENATQ